MKFQVDIMTGSHVVRVNCGYSGMGKYFFKSLKLWEIYRIRTVGNFKAWVYKVFVACKFVRKCFLKAWFFRSRKFDKNSN